jgi:glutathionylspermidine synthase
MVSVNATNIDRTIRATRSLAPAALAEVRRRAIFDCCKWDPQVEDVSVLAPFALLIDQSAWDELAGLSELLARETIAAEREILARPELHSRLGLPRSIRRALSWRGHRQIASVAGGEAAGAGRTCHGGTACPAELARVMRFDFHLTAQGWRITEVNSDVPGGFIEASGVTQLMARQIPDTRIAADPAAALADALARSLPGGSRVGLVHATAYTDDRQVMIYLSRHLESRGLRTCLLAPDQIDWTGGRARIATDWCGDHADALLRFFPGEWLANLPVKSGWRHFFGGAITPLCNPATALLTQSKRFPLTWDDLAAPLPTWRSLLPETRDPRQVSWWNDPGWVVKPALGRVGDSIGMRGVTPQKEMKQISRWMRWGSSRWAAQRRFETLPVVSDAGPVFPCLGVYTIGGKAAGVYGRVAVNPLVNHHARDVAVLIDSAIRPGQCGSTTGRQARRNMELQDVQ